MINSETLIKEIEALEDQLNSNYALYEAGYNDAIKDIIIIIKKLSNQDMINIIDSTIIKI